MLLPIELEDWSGKKVFAHYNMFKVDKENDMWKTGICSNGLTGGWWFNDCHNSDLNGQFMGNIHKVKALMEIITRVSCH